MSLSISLSSSFGLVLNNLRLSTGVPGTESFREYDLDSEGVSLGLDAVESSGLSLVSVTLPWTDCCLTSSTFGGSIGFGDCSTGFAGGSSIIGWTFGTSAGLAACSLGALIGAIICSTGKIEFCFYQNYDKDFKLIN